MKKMNDLFPYSTREQDVFHFLFTYTPYKVERTFKWKLFVLYIIISRFFKKYDK